jgi:hypothetical protein
LAPEPLLPLPGVIGAGAGLVVLGLVVLGLVVLGLGVVVLGLVTLPLPVAPAPARARRSRSHSARFSPTRSLHVLRSILASAPPVALPPAAAPVEGKVGGDTVPPAAAPPLTPAPDEVPVLPEVEPEDCAKLADDKARRAAAVAAVSAFNIMWMIS